LATANKLHEATITAGASRLFPKLKLPQVDPIHREAASAKANTTRPTQKDHPIASARAEEVISSKKKRKTTTI
jgi:hypothetical protein